MSVRRLADPELQPPSFAFSDAMTREADKWIAKYPEGRQQSAVIPLLMLAQEQDGWVTRAAIERVAEMLRMPLIRVLEVATFYTQFQLKPVGTRAHVQVCGTTPCMIRGSEALMDVCRSRIHPEQFHTNADGTLSWEEVECLGACVNAPMVMIFKDTYEDLTPESLGEIIAAFERGDAASVTPGPQIDRIYAAPQTGLTSLVDEEPILKTTRDREAREPKPDNAQVPPSNAARPKTHAPETDPALKSPTARKTPPAAETPSPAPAFDKTAANITEPLVEGGEARERAGGGRRAAEVRPGIESPELISGAPIGASGKRVARSTSIKPSLAAKNRPAGIERPGQPDDLTLISGIGPKIEATLHSLGIFTYAQVASWKKAERDWIDGYLNFKGRIERDDWVKQAKALAKGGVDEYVRVFGKKPV